jgi:hypothetical protein
MMSGDTRAHDSSGEASSQGNIQEESSKGRPSNQVSSLLEAARTRWTKCCEFSDYSADLCRFHAALCNGVGLCSGRAFAAKAMGTKDVRIDPKLNIAVWTTVRPAYLI